MRRMMLIAASCPSNRLAEVTKRILSGRVELGETAGNFSGAEDMVVVSTSSFGVALCGVLNALTVTLTSTSTFRQAHINPFFLVSTWAADLSERMGSAGRGLHKGWANGR